MNGGKDSVEEKEGERKLLGQEKVKDLKDSYKIKILCKLLMNTREQQLPLQGDVKGRWGWGSFCCRRKKNRNPIVQGHLRNPQ